jgi:hypothetical protein
VQAAADRSLEANLGVPRGALHTQLQSWTVSLGDDDSGEVLLDLRARVPLAFGGLFGMSTLPVKAEAASTGGLKNLEVALVLDNTGSMAQGGKIAILRQATVGLIAHLDEVAARNPDQSAPLKVALIPFSMTVRLDTPDRYRNAGWLDGEANGEGYRADSSFDRFDRYPQGGWAGCVESRPAPYDVNNANPAGGNSDYVPYFNTDGSSPNSGCELQPLQRLTKNTGERSPLVRAAESMVAVGNTNIPLGLAWGWTALAPRGEGPFGDGVAYDHPKTTKAVVLMTDGQNNISLGPQPNGGPYSGIGYPRQGRMGVRADGDIAQRRAALDARLSVLCENMKSRGVVLYTVRVATPGSPDVMRDCATSPGHFYEVRNPRDLPAVFGEIAESLTELRLSR